MCAFGVLGLSCEARAAPKPPGLHSPRAQTCTFKGSGLQKHHQNSTRRHPERHKKSEMVAGEGKKSEILGGPAEGGPSEVTTSGQNRFRPGWPKQVRPV